MLSINDEKYEEYEVYYLMNFVLLDCKVQEGKFFCKKYYSCEF